MAHRDGRERPAAGAFRMLDAGTALFRPGDAATSLFAVRQGMIKTVHLSEDGHERIIAFHVPGEVFGLDAFSSDSHRCEAVAVEHSVCCELPLPARAERPQVQGLLPAVVALLGRAAAPKLPLARGSARERVTRFLRDLAERLRRHGLDGERLRLSMSRSDIANFLDTRIETVSRTLQQLHRMNAICVHGSTVDIIDLPASDAALP
jgi:CRP/FNR family transcriptional regulator